QEKGQSQAALSDRRPEEGVADRDGADLQVGQGPRRRRDPQPGVDPAWGQDELRRILVGSGGGGRERKALPAARYNGGLSVLLRLRDRLEEWLIATLIAAATVLIFFAVLHRYGTGESIVWSKALAARGVPVLPDILRAIYLGFASLDVSWAQELCI